MAMYDIKGVVDVVGKTQSFGSNGFQKREIVINAKEDGQKYDNLVKLTFKKDNCAMLDGFRKGDVVKIRFAVDGRKWDGPKGTQYFVDLTGIKIEADGVAADAEAAMEPEPVQADDVEDMPF